MTPERAFEIVAAINARCFFKMELTDTLPPLAGISLTEMVEAKNIVEAGNAARSKVYGGHSISLIPDDRLIAAAYALEHYPPDDECVLFEPLSNRDRFLTERTHKAIAVVAVTPQHGADDE